MKKVKQQSVDGIKAFYAKSVEEWRTWLDKNGQQEKSVWLVIYHKKSRTQSVNYEEAIVHALCYGWIDSKAIKLDNESFYLSFYPRKPKSKWSIKNRKRAADLISAGLMTSAGLLMIDIAKKNGNWDSMTDVHIDNIQNELELYFKKKQNSTKKLSGISTLV